MGYSKRVGHHKSPEEPPSKRLKEGDADEDYDKKTSQGESQTTAQLPSFAEEAVEDEILKAPKVDILKWTVRDVVEFIQNLPGCQDYAEDFELQEIDGQALMLLKADHLMSAMSIKLGPALKICAKIEAMRADRKDN